MNSFYSQEELKKIGFLSIGKNVLISKKASIYNPGVISVGNHVRIDDFCILSGKITIGSYSHISAYTALYGGEVGIEMHDFANISAKTLVYAVLDDFSGNTLMGPTVPNQYRNVETEKVIFKKHAIIGADSIIFSKCNYRRRYGSRCDEYGEREFRRLVYLCWSSRKKNKTSSKKDARVRN